MITRDELKRIFTLLRKHEALLITAYLEPDGIIPEVDEHRKAIDALIEARLVWRPAEHEAVRLSRELSGLFERVLRDPRRLTVDTDIGGFINSLEDNVNGYKAAQRKCVQADIQHYAGQIERLVDDLRSCLRDRSRQLWQKINSEFGYVTSLELKIKENEMVLQQAKRLNDSLELIKVQEMDELVGGDPQLHRYLHRWLLDSVELCRQETVDAMHKLNVRLFEYRQQQKLGRLINAFYRRYQTHPGYLPLDYTAMGDIPPVFNQVSPMPMMAQADIADPQQEWVLTDLIEGLRQERVPVEETEALQHIAVQGDDPPTEIQLTPLRQAVEDFFLRVVDSNEPLSAVACRPPEDIEADVALWLYAIIARHNNMDRDERRLFNLYYQETVDPLFDGRYLVQDVYMGLTNEISG